MNGAYLCYLKTLIVRNSGTLMPPLFIELNIYEASRKDLLRSRIVLCTQLAMHTAEFNYQYIFLSIIFLTIHRGVISLHMTVYFAYVNPMLTYRFIFMV